MTPMGRRVVAVGVEGAAQDQTNFLAATESHVKGAMLERFLHMVGLADSLTGVENVRLLHL